MPKGRPGRKNAHSATAFALSGPTSGATGTADIFTVRVDATVANQIAVNISAPGAALNPSSLVFPGGTSSPQTFTVTRAVDGMTSVAITNTGGLVNTGTPIVYVSSGAIDADWLARSTAAGVVVANRLDTQAARDAWVLNDGTQGHVTLDLSVKASPFAAGSLRFASLNADTTSNGSIGVPLGASYGNNSTVWFSYRIRVPREQAWQQWVNNGETGTKFSILSHSSGSNQANEVVVQVNYNGGLISGYWQDGAVSGLTPDINAVTACSSFDFRWQPGIDRGANTLTGLDPETGTAWSACAQERRRYGGLYAAKSLGSYKAGLGDPLSGGFKQYPDEWITVTGRVAAGTMDGSTLGGSANSRWSLWAAREGQPYQLLHDKQNIILGSGPAYNTLWLLPYTSSRSTGGRKVSAVSAAIGGISVPVCGLSTAVGAGTIEYTAATGLFRFAALNDNYGTARGFSVANGVTTMNLRSSSDGVGNTTTTTTVTLPVASLALADASGLPVSGTVIVGVPDTSNPGSSSGVGEQRVNYTGKVGNTLTGCAGGIGTHNAGSPCQVSSFVVVSVDTVASLPSSGVTTAAVTIAEGRPDTQANYADVILSTQAINAPGGYPPAGVSALGDLAASMSSNSWANFTMGNLVNATFFANSTSGTLGILNGNSPRLVWDSLHKKMQLAACAHTGGAIIAGAGGLATWDDVANQWSRETYSWSSENPGHGYYHNAINPNNGDMYFRSYNSRNIYRRIYGQTEQASWQVFSVMNGPNYFNQVAGGLEWFPGLNSGAGGLVFVDQGGANVSNVALSSWSTAAGSMTGIGLYHNFIAYTPSSARVYFGGGNGSVKMYSLDASGTATVRADTPIEAGAGTSFGEAAILPHPNGTGLLLFGPFTGGVLYNFDGTAWTSLGTHQIGVSDGIWSACTVPEYGVVVFIKFQGASGTPTCKVYKP